MIQLLAGHGHSVSEVMNYTLAQAMWFVGAIERQHKAQARALENLESE